MALINLSKWFKDRTNEVRDVFDANTADDQKRRVAQGQARMYADQQAQIPASQQRPINVIRREFRPALSETFTNPNSWNKGPRLNVGNFKGSGIIEDFVNSPFKMGKGGVQVGQGQYKQGAGNIVSGAIEGPLGLLPVGRVAQLGKGTKLTTRLVSGAKQGLKEGAVYGGAYGASVPMAENRDWGDVAQGGAIGAVTGAVGGGLLGGGAPVVGSGVKATTKLVKQANTPKPIPDNLLQTRNELIRGRQNAIQQKRTDLLPVFDKQIDAIDAQISKATMSPIKKALQPQRGSVQNPFYKETQTQVQTLEQPKVKLQTAEPPLPPAKVGVQTMSPPPDGPKSGVKELPSGKTKATKFASKTVPESEFVSEPVKGSIKAPDYSPQTEKQGYTNALGRLKQQGDDVFEQDVFTNLNKKPGTISRQEAIDSTTLAQILDSKGDDASIRKATEIYEKLSEHYTAAGQTIQVAAILSKRTPEGMRGWATSTLKKAGVEPTPQLQTQIVALAKEKKFTELADLVSKNIPSSTGDKIINFWRAGLLTAPTTTFGNLLGNTGEAAVRKGFVNPVATLADALMGQFTGKRTMTLAKPGELGKGAKQGAKEFKQGSDNTKYDIQKRTNYNTKALDGYVNGVYKLMGVADKPFSTATTKEALSSMAKAEAINKGLKGEARDKFVKEFVNNPPEQARLRAEQEGDYSVFKNPTTLGKAASGLKKPLGPVGDFVVPFTQVPAAIATRIVQRTPVGTAHEVMKQITHIKSGGEFDQRAMSQAIGNGLFGPAIMGVGYALANENLLTFGYPSDKKERALWDEEGKQPYSVKVGDRWYSLNYLQPFGALLAVGGQASETAKKGGDITEVVGQGVATAGQSILNQSFLKGIGGVISAVSDPEQNVQNYVEQTSSSLVPNFIRSAARAGDDIQRKPEGIVEGVKSGFPGLRGQTTPKYSQITGDPLPAKDNFANQYVNPFKPSKVRETDLTAELRRLQDNELGVIPTQANKDMFGKDSGITDKQIKEVNSLVAKGISDEWKKIIADPRFKSLSDEDKKKVLAKVNDIVSPAVKADYAAKNNFISDKWEPKLNADQRAYLTDGLRDVLATTVAKPKTTKVAKSKSTRKSSGKRRKSISYQSISPIKKVTMGGAKNYSAPSVKLSRPKRRVAKRTIRIKA